MRINGLAVALALVSLPVVSSAQNKPGDPWLNTTWVNGNTTLTMIPWEDGLKLLETHSDNSNRVVAFARMGDGKIYRETGITGWDGASFNRIDDRTYEYVGTKEGKVVSRVKVTFPLDGLTRVSQVTVSNGEPVQRPQTVWKRKQVLGNKEPWYGTWQTNEGRSTLIMEPWEDGFELSFTTLPSSPGGTVSHGSAFARFDGYRYAETGNSSADYLVFKKIDERTISVDYIKNDKPGLHTVLTFPPDGKTRISKATGIGEDGKPFERTTTWTRVEQ